MAFTLSLFFRPGPPWFGTLYGGRNSVQRLPETPAGTDVVVVVSCRLLAESAEQRLGARCSVIFMGQSGAIGPSFYGVA